MAKNYMNPKWKNYISYIILFLFGLFFSFTDYSINLSFFAVIVLRIGCLINILLLLYLIFYCDDNEIAKYHKIYWQVVEGNRKRNKNKLTIRERLYGILLYWLRFIDFGDEEK